MNSKLYASILVAGAMILPMAGHAADSDADRSSPGAFVKDSVITTKIKAELAEQKLSSLLHISVDTDKNGMVVMTGTADNQQAVDKAISIARSVSGVTSVRSTIRVAGAAAPAPARTATGAAGAVPAGSGKAAAHEERVEKRIKSMHAALHITQPQEEQWGKVAQVMRDNAKSMDALTQARFDRAKSMTAVEDLKSYAEITDAHADGIKKFTPVFATLYDSMSDAQKKDADAMFRQGHGGRKSAKVG